MARRVAACSKMAGLGSSVAVPCAFLAITTAVSAAAVAWRVLETLPLICTGLTPVAQPGRSRAATACSVRPQLTPSVRGTGRSVVR